MLISKFDSALSSFTSPKAANNSDRCLRRARVKRRGAGLLSIALLATALYAGPAYAAENDGVRVWNERAVVTLTNGTTAAAPGLQFAPPVAFINLAIVQGAVYDAGNAIKGGQYGKPPSLSELVLGDNLESTTDFRRVYATLIEDWLGADAKHVLGRPFESLGFVKA